MNRIFTTTALSALLLTGAAYAEQHTTTDSAAMDQTGSGGVFAQVPANPDLQRGTDLIGMTVYTMMGGSGGDQPAADSGSADTTSSDTSGSADSGSATAQDQRQSIGEINDLIITRDGSVDYVIVGVGGFLGIGERNVAVNMDSLEYNPPMQDGGEMFLTIPASQSEIENAPEFDPASLEAGGSAGSSMDSGQATGDAAQQSGQAAEQAGQNAEQAAEEAGQNAEQAAEEAGQNAEQAADAASQEAEQAAEDAGQAAENAAEEAGQAAEDAGQAVEDAGQAAEQEVEEETSGN
ncbi:PRC-barrel domain-containing protein [Palleronia rufa]|uniref:PRC-barrel domain-containing protein n=1 Tax=Palleronia rufa TaxID=1530186 RepID=UPI000566DD56|nr:PRC-barrel domain-containing protein [Palleronia rufa]